ncbi:hypothetical protein Scep_013308 [Stephania cephalantha]|uniref:Uncharacterized protein n=1 Tax=Stephania cephalantha TaxID=152367 RepID=A0AAP0PAI1_9MAGN
MATVKSKTCTEWIVRGHCVEIAVSAQSDLNWLRFWIDRIIRCSLRSQVLPSPAIEPVPESCVSTVEERTLGERERWWKMGLKAISDGKLAVLLLSGGQPNAFYAFKRLAAQSVNEGSGGFVPIHWYIMTSPFTDASSLKVINILVLKLIKSPSFSKVAKAPDGKGALKTLKLLEDMAMRGVRYVDCYGVDNALVRVADPTFLGYFIEKGVTAAAKVVPKLVDYQLSAISYQLVYPISLRNGEGFERWRSMWGSWKNLRDGKVEGREEM